MSASSDLAADRAIADALPRAWSAFLARFGRLTDIQRRAIPLILEGQDVLACAPTASGKTEAAAAPLVEQHMGHSRDWTVLYISPTRALVNDLHERLHTPLEQLGLRLVRRTGDHKDALTAIPNVLLTTPESFDSLLCRGRDDRHGHALASTVAVVLDEIHLLHGSARGEQVRWLIERLRRLRRFAVEKGWARRAGLQVIGLSATVPDPEGLFARFAEHGQVVRASGARTIETVTARCDAPSVEAALPAYLASSSQSEKILVFSDSRRRVDQLATSTKAQLEKVGYSVRAHHGSLARRSREATEEAIKVANRIVVFATSTLELGIDIGDIDLVVLDGPAPSVSSLLQRIGRGNRRSTLTRVMACANSTAEIIVQSAMIESARAGELGPIERGPHLAVARQQTASYIFQAPRRSRSRQSVASLIEGLEPEVSGGEFIDHMLREGELLEDGDGVRLGEEWVEHATKGEIHSNIEGGAGDTVVDHESGQEIAMEVRFKGGKGLAIAGELLQVKAWSERKLEVKRVRDQHEAEGAWGYVTHAWMKGAGQAQAVRQYLRLSEDQWPVISGAGQTCAFHFGGARRRAVLEMVRDQVGDTAKAVKVNEWFITIPGSDASRPPWLSSGSAAGLSLLLPKRLSQLERTLARPHANKHLPLDLRLREVQAWLNLDGEFEAIRAARWVDVDDSNTAMVLRELSIGMG